MNRHHDGRSRLINRRRARRFQAMADDATAAGDVVATRLAVCHPDDVAGARDATHDALCDELGDRRRGEVWWLKVPVAQLSDHERDLIASPDAVRFMALNPDWLVVVACARAVVE